MSHPSSVHTLMTMLITAAIPLVAADLGRDPMYPRIVGEVLVGTADFEPGIAAEWRVGDPRFMIRPEVFRNTDARLGVGASLGWEMDFLHLPERHAVTIGPRVVFHNADQYDWGADAMGIWHFDLIPSQPGRHFMELIGTVGVIQNDADADKRTTPAGSVGLAYGFQF